MTPAGFRAIHGLSTSECEAPQPKPPVILALVAAESANRHRQRSGAHVLQMAVAYRPQVKPALRLTTRSAPRPCRRSCGSLARTRKSLVERRTSAKSTRFSPDGFRGGSAALPRAGRILIPGLRT